MRPQWNESDRALLAAEVEAAGMPAILGHRLYSARLIGQDSDLALHGYGSASVKIAADDGEARLHVLAASSQASLSSDPGVFALAPLLALRNTPTLPPDAQRQALLAGRSAKGNDSEDDADRARPDSDVFLHAFLPHRFVDHAHPAAVLALANQPDMGDQIDRIYGGRVGFIPYVQPGHGLAQACLKAIEAKPDLIGLWLEQHGLITFGDSAQESHARLIDCVTLAQDHLRAHGVEMPPPEADDLAPPEDLAEDLKATLIARGTLGKKPGIIFRSSPSIRRWLARDDLADLALRGPVSPEHVIALRPFAMIIPDDAGDVAIDLALRDFEQDYREWFTRNSHQFDTPPEMHDPLPRAVLVPGLGAYGLGHDRAEAQIVTDLLEQAARIVNAAEDYGRFEPVSEAELLAVEYGVTP